MQQITVKSLGGQSASPSMFSQKRTGRPLVHFPLHGLNGSGFGLVVVVRIDGCLVAAIIVVVIIVIAEAIAETLVGNDVFGRVVVNGDETLLRTPPPFFSS